MSSFVIGQTAGCDEYEYTVLGYLLQSDGVWIVGQYIHKQGLTGEWFAGFNREPEQVMEQVSRLPLTLEQKVELVEQGVFPNECPVEKHHMYIGLPRPGMFEEVKHLVS